ncbi:MAG TPA: hypothetical protein VJ044_13210, partial [Candidatus Hodarchaeales archaeon]|nr:hypothetical protein [Candidatus Hodarchaeales archaeon]
DSRQLTPEQFLKRCLDGDDAIRTWFENNSLSLEERQALIEYLSNDRSSDKIQMVEGNNEIIHAALFEESGQKYLVLITLANDDRSVKAEFNLPVWMTAGMVSFRYMVKDCILNIDYGVNYEPRVQVEIGRPYIQVLHLIPLFGAWEKKSSSILKQESYESKESRRGTSSSVQKEYLRALEFINSREAGEKIYYRPTMDSGTVSWIHALMISLLAAVGFTFPQAWTIIALTGAYAIFHRRVLRSLKRGCQFRIASMPNGPQVRHSPDAIIDLYLEKLYGERPAGLIRRLRSAIDQVKNLDKNDRLYIIQNRASILEDILNEATDFLNTPNVLEAIVRSPFHEGELETWRDRAEAVYFKKYRRT